MGEQGEVEVRAPDRRRAYKMVAGLTVALAVHWLCGTSLAGWPLMILLLVGAFWEPALAFAWTLREWEKIGKEGLQRRQERAAAAEVRAGQEDVERARMTEAAPVPEERSVGVRP